MSEQNCTHDCGSCGSDCSARTEPMKEPTHELSNIKKVIAVGKRKRWSWQIFGHFVNGVTMTAVDIKQQYWTQT